MYLSNRSALYVIRHISTCSTQKKTLIPGRYYKPGKTHWTEELYIDKVTKSS